MIIKENMITFTDLAVKKIKELVRKRARTVGIRIGVKTTGCSGLSYVLEYLENDSFSPYEDRIVYPDFIVKVSLKDKVYLQGMIVDWKKQGLNEGFDFSNPNERDRCGCGESFRV